MEELKARLLKHAIDITRFGTGCAKSLEDLFAEVESGEAELIERDGRLVRHLAVLDINVFTDVGGRHRLVEDRQEFADGRVRRRELPTSVSEKLHKEENILEAIARALEEELGIRQFNFLSPASQVVESVESPSFPGLMSEYLIHRVEVLIDPSEYKDGYQEVQNDKTTHFVWSTQNKKEN